jgi:hypothetical protein
VLLRPEKSPHINLISCINANYDVGDFSSRSYVESQLGIESVSLTYDANLHLI